MWLSNKTKQSSSTDLPKPLRSSSNNGIKQNNRTTAGPSPLAREAQRVLVTGGLGFIGSHLVEFLLGRGDSVFIADDNSQPAVSREWIQNLMSRHRARALSNVFVDIRDLESMRRLLPKDIDVIVHLAALPGVRPSVNNPSLYHDANVVGTENVLQFATDCDVSHVVFASSSTVYGANPNLPWSEDSTPLAPTNPYAETKVVCEELGRAFCERDGNSFTALRFFSVYGPRQRRDLVARIFAGQMIRNRSLRIFGDGEYGRDFTYIDDAVSAIVSSMSDHSDNLGGFQVFNVGTGKTHTLNQLVAILESQLGRKAKVEHLHINPADSPRTRADITRARKLLSYEPATDLSDGLQLLCDWIVATESQQQEQPEFSSTDYAREFPANL